MLCPTFLSFVIAPILILSTFLLTVPSSAQSTSYPDRVVHGWWPDVFAPSPAPSTGHLIYVLDGQFGVVLVDARDGGMLRNASFAGAAFYLDQIVVDSRGYVFVTTWPFRNVDPSASSQLLVFNSGLTQLHNLSFSTLQPTTTTRDMQVVVDSTNTVFLFDGNPFSSTFGCVWTLSARGWQQLSSWQAPINLDNQTFYLLAIDNQDYLYFQQVSGYKMLYITDRSGAVLMSYQLGTGNASDPDIDDVAIDAQLQMWHTHQYSTLISVIDSNGKLVAVYDVLTYTSRYEYRTNHIAVDAYNNVLAMDSSEDALLFVSQRGDITNSLSSPVAPMWQVSELLGDYVGAGRGAGSPLYSDYYSPYGAKRISADDAFQRGECIDGYTHSNSQSAHLAVSIA